MPDGTNDAVRCQGDGLEGCPVPGPSDVERNLTVWLVRLSCGCVQEIVTHGWDDYPDDHQYPDPDTKFRLPLGELWCRTEHGVKPPYREIVGWIRRDVVELPGDPVEPPDGVDGDVWERVRETHPFSRAFWTVRLICGHYASNVSSEIDWDCEDGPMYASAAYLKRLRRAYERHWAKRGEAAWPEEGPERDHVRRRLDLGWLQPETEAECRSCVHARLMVGYRAVSGPATSAPPSAVDRKRLAARLAAAEASVSRLRMRLEALERC